MKILIAGSSGLVGSALVSYLRGQGHLVTRLVRQENKQSEDAILWDPLKGVSHLDDLEGFDAVINLAGENIASGRWTAAKKERIINSRVIETRTLCTQLIQLQNPPKVLVNASAMGFYGDGGDSELTEGSPNGQGFLAEVCREWEAATQSAEKRGIRVVKLRTSVVLTPNGGALAKMLTPFRLGLGGVIGSGKQYMSWIALEDIIQIILFVLVHKEVSGPINVSTPYPVTNEEFTKTLGRVLQRPTFMTIPEWMVRFIFGEMGEALLLSSTRAIPERLLEMGYSYRYPHLEAALNALLE